MIILGESEVRKTSILKRYVYNRFDEGNISTIGLSFAFKDYYFKK